MTRALELYSGDAIDSRRILCECCGLAAVGEYDGEAVCIWCASRERDCDTMSAREALGVCEHGSRDCADCRAAAAECGSCRGTGEVRGGSDGRYTCPTCRGSGLSGPAE